jgi:hypothetical protein
MGVMSDRAGSPADARPDPRSLYLSGLSTGDFKEGLAALLVVIRELIAEVDPVCAGT